MYKYKRKLLKIKKDNAILQCPAKHRYLSFNVARSTDSSFDDTSIHLVINSEALSFSSNVQVDVRLLACGYISGQLTDARLTN